ncbi:thioredoxin [Entomomonas sp. E2T0]|uniref:thioredoxin n=1 Tax=Entomomonas sp. E2T0 TaxID=2930213 RepID=UPI0022282BB3|nr:thioredoxin [Entomomonas sp. E2T0]
MNLGHNYYCIYATQTQYNSRNKHLFLTLINEINFMATIEITTENFEQTIENNDIVILDFWAAWCGPCRNFAPTFEASSEKHTDIVFGKINTEEQEELAGSFGVRSIPTIAVFREQVVVYFEAGALTAADFENLIEQVRGLDMEKIKAEIAAEQQNA